MWIHSRILQIEVKIQLSYRFYNHLDHDGLLENGTHGTKHPPSQPKIPR